MGKAIVLETVADTILDARILDFGLPKPSGGNGFNR
jgi:hypothetical protein